MRSRGRPTPSVPPSLENTEKHAPTFSPARSINKHPFFLWKKKQQGREIIQSPPPSLPVPPPLPPTSITSSRCPQNRSGLLFVHTADVIYARQTRASPTRTNTYPRPPPPYVAHHHAWRRRRWLVLQCPRRPHSPPRTWADWHLAAP